MISPRRLALLLAPAARFAVTGALPLVLIAAPVDRASAAPKHRAAANGHRAVVPHRRMAGVAPLPPGVERPTNDVYLSLGQGELVNLPVAASSVWVSNPTAADVYVNNPRQINLFGKAFGETTIFAMGPDGHVAYAANLHVSQNVSGVEQTLRAALPHSDIHVLMVSQMAVLQGTVASPNDSAEAETMTTMLLNPGTKPGSGEGLKIAVINRLKTATPLQVLLRVRIAEVNRSWARQLDNNIITQMNGKTTVAGISRGANQGSIVTSGGTTTYNFPSSLSNETALSLGTKLGGLSLLDTLDAGEQVGLVSELAEPNLTALSGETAEFLAGGQFPIPVAQGGSGTSGVAISIEYKNYGVSLAYTPTVMANGHISLRVRPEVSELSTQGAVTLNGFSVPALTVRRAETTVELGSGQSFMIAGLLSNNASHTIEKLPGAGDLPVLGALFKSSSFQKNETELVIVVTPYLVSPTDDANIKLPTDGAQTPDEAQRILGQMLTDGQSGATRPGPTAAAPAGTPPPATTKGADSGKGKSDHTAANAAATPGFTLN